MTTKAQAFVVIGLGVAAWWVFDQVNQIQQAQDEADAPDIPMFNPWADAEALYSDFQLSMTNDQRAASNEAAFLRVIRHAEGTAGLNGYRTRFGNVTFPSLADHPRIAVQFTDKKGRRLWTSAAGAYQFMAVSPIPGGGSTKVNTWDRIKAKLSLPDFSPASQDKAAIELIREVGALPDVRAGRFAQAVAKVRGIWASLPGAGYDQPERSLAELASVYQRNGGALA